MIAFVTGATGFLGVNLIEELTREGWQVVALHRKTSDLRPLVRLNVTLKEGDVTDIASLERALPEGVDAVFHLAGAVGFFGPKRYEEQRRTNVDGTRNMVEVALKKKPRRFIHTSTVLVYDYSNPGRITEETPMNGQGSRLNYIRTKALADGEVQKGVDQGLDAVILHASAMFGAYDVSTWSRLFREIQEGTRHPVPPGKTSWCHARAVARAHIQAFHKGRSGEHYILGGPDATIFEMVQEIGKLLDRPIPGLVLPGWLFRFIGRLESAISLITGKEPLLTPDLIDMLTRTILLNSEKAQRELGYVASSLEEMLVDCYEWMVREGLLPRKRPPSRGMRGKDG